MLLDLGDGIVGGLLEVDMRGVGELAGFDDAVDDRRSANRQSLDDGIAQLPTRARFASLMSDLLS